MEAPLLQKTAFQNFTGLISPHIKRSGLINTFLKAGNVVSGLSSKGIIYGDVGSVTFNILRRLNKETDPKEIAHYLKECKVLFKPAQRLEYGDRTLALHALIRILKPNVVVETGCAWGGSASFLLAALEKNGRGELISIDLPASTVSQAKFMGVNKDQIGALVPEELRKRWKLVTGDARIELPRILAENDADIFIHDSLHTTTHQAFEYITARSLMREGALIVSDDIRWNGAFRSFVQLHNLRGYILVEDKNFGFALNTFDGYEKENGLYR
ncbi:MAG: class I SAM-dependent methyltransferase [Bdellovibrionales bacterium]|nr:class I SAM-dependent methyltransferase [Bdellovibrionales bacterium]